MDYLPGGYPDPGYQDFEDEDDPIRALAFERLRRQGTQDLLAQDRERQNRSAAETQARNEAQRQLERLRAGQSTVQAHSNLPQTNPTPSGGVHESNPYAATGEMKASYEDKLRSFPGVEPIRKREPLNFSMGDEPMHAYDPNGPDIGAPGRGGLSMQPLGVQSTPEEWESRVANPAAFSAYRESVVRPQMEAERSMDRALTADPFIKEKTLAGLQMQQHQGLEGYKAGLQRQTESERRNQYLSAVEQEQNDAAEMLSRLDALKIDPAIKQQRASLIHERLEQRITEIKDAFGLGAKMTSGEFYK